MGEDLEGTSAIVTGGASGIGRALVEQLTARGARVMAVDLDDDGLAETCNRTGSVGRKADVSSLEENEAFVSEAVDQFGRLDMIFLNAGILDRDHQQAEYGTADLDLKRYALVRAVNTDGVVYGSVAAARAMARSGGGSVVATASVAGLVGYEATPFYSATKSAVIGWVRAIGAAMRKEGVRINAICPGGVATPMLGLEADSDAAAAAAEVVPTLLAPAELAGEMIATARSDAAGKVFSVVAGREVLGQEHPFAEVPGFS
jgi:NAD(P)-dependent dehydrogenase (short-subunit alcohol dehydrogenase family)